MRVRGSRMGGTPGSRGRLCCHTGRVIPQAEASGAHGPAPPVPPHLGPWERGGPGQPLRLSYFPGHVSHKRGAAAKKKSGTGEAPVWGEETRKVRVRVSVWTCGPIVEGSVASNAVFSPQFTCWALEGRAAAQGVPLGGSQPPSVHRHVAPDKDRVRKVIVALEDSTFGKCAQDWLLEDRGPVRAPEGPAPESRPLPQTRLLRDSDFLPGQGCSHGRQPALEVPDVLTGEPRPGQGLSLPDAGDRQRHVGAGEGGVRSPRPPQLRGLARTVAGLGVGCGAGVQ